MTAPAAAAPIGRILTAMVTPFTDDGALDLESAARLATQLVDDGNDGLIVSGTTGESPTTSDAEKDLLLRAVIEAVGDRARIVAGVGTNNTEHTIYGARAAQAAGADAILVVTPYYNKPPQASLIAHFTAVADATDLPNVLYDIPGRSGVPILTETLQRLAEHPQIVAVKDAKADFFGSSEVMATTDLVFYSGDDAFTFTWFAHGAAGVIGVATHGFAGDYAAMQNAFDAGDLAAARAIHNKLIPAVKAVMSPKSQGAIRSKALMHLRGVIASPYTRMPLLPADATDLAELRSGCAAAGLNLGA